MQALYDKYKDQGFVVLSISDEEAAKVTPFIAERKISYPVLLDPGRKVNEAFVVEGIPKSFVYDREGKLVAQSIDMRTRSQFQQMLAQAGLQMICVGDGRLRPSRERSERGGDGLACGMPIALTSQRSCLRAARNPGRRRPGLHGESFLGRCYALSCTSPR